MSAEVKTHPITDMFPMLPEDELRDLAADIKAHGLLQPITRDSEGRVLDGRNRYKACEIAGVEPRFETYKGDDPDTYAVSVNLRRRHLTKQQRHDVIVKLSDMGWSTRRIAETTGADQKTVRKKVREIPAPDTVIGKDGKTYPAKKSKRGSTAKSNRENKRAEGNRLLKKLTDDLERVESWRGQEFFDVVATEDGFLYCEETLVVARHVINELLDDLIDRINDVSHEEGWVE